MANSDQILSLIKSHVDGDDARFRMVVMQMAAMESRQGHVVIAKALHDVMNAGKIHQLRPLRGTSGDAEELLTRVEATAKMADLAVDDTISEALKRVVYEYEQRDKLRRYNLDNRHKLLLAGPSGTGKTMSASVLAKELGLSLYVVRLERVITKFMGETGLKLSKIFDYMAEVPGVYLFDEFDAIGSQRGMENEVGEQRRILNAFLQMMERPMYDSIIVAATNAMEAIDKALFRRFDDVLLYSLPTEKEIVKLIYDTTGKRDFVVTRTLISAMNHLSHADICAVCLEALKNELLYQEKVDEKSLIRIAKEHGVTKNYKQSLG